MSRSHRIAVLSWLVVGACADPVPETPTWFGDVQPNLSANCAPCHGASPEQDSIAGFRRDRYVAGDDATLDAYDYRESIVRQAGARVAPVMPPAYALSDRQRDVLERWVAADAPKGSRDNALPTAVPVDCRLGEFHLTGEIRRATANGLVHYRCACLKAKDLLRLWIEHLLSNAAAPAGRGRGLCWSAGMKPVRPCPWRMRRRCCQACWNSTGRA